MTLCSYFIRTLSFIGLRPVNLLENLVPLHSGHTYYLCYVLFQTYLFNYPKPGHHLIINQVWDLIE
jgi:hypothetical protein